jgi:hypothetical protein
MVIVSSGRIVPRVQQGLAVYDSALLMQTSTLCLESCAHEQDLSNQTLLALSLCIVACGPAARQRPP